MSVDENSGYGTHRLRLRLRPRLLRSAYVMKAKHILWLVLWLLLLALTIWIQPEFGDPFNIGGTTHD